MRFFNYHEPSTGSRLHLPVHRGEDDGKEEGAGTGVHRLTNATKIDTNCRQVQCDSATGSGSLPTIAGQFHAFIPSPHGHALLTQPQLTTTEPRAMGHEPRILNNFRFVFGSLLVGRWSSSSFGFWRLIAELTHCT